MRSRIGNSDVSDKDLQSYFDDELAGAEAQELAAQIESDPDLKAEVASLQMLRAVVSESAMVQARDIHAARFEQVWREIDRRTQGEAGAASSQAALLPADGFLPRLLGWIRPLRWPAAAAAVAAVMVMVVRPDTSGPGPEPVVAQAGPEAVPPSTGSRPSVEVSSPSDRSPQFDVPKAELAEVFDVEFGGRNGTISQSGTVTVLYVEEDARLEDSERSL